MYPVMHAPCSAAPWQRRGTSLLEHPASCELATQLLSCNGRSGHSKRDVRGVEDVMCILTKAEGCILSYMKWLPERILACQHEGNRGTGLRLAVVALDLFSLIYTTSTHVVGENADCQSRTSCMELLRAVGA